MLQLSSLVVLGIFLLLPTTAFAQPPEVTPADQKRIEELERGGLHVTGDHVELWFPMTVSRRDAESLRDRLDRAIGEARQMLGTQPWQRLGTQKIAYYFLDEGFGGHGTGLGKVFVPTASLKQAEGAYLLYFGVTELLVPRPYLLEGKVEGNVFAPDLVLSVLLGLRHYIRLTAGERTGFVETGQYDLGRLRDIDTLCVTRVRATEPSMILPYVGAAGRPAWGADQPKYQPAFLACSTSFTKFLIEESTFERVLALIARLPDGAKAVHTEIERITGRPITTLQTEWQRKIGVSP